jgi:hypothetical protein
MNLWSKYDKFNFCFFEICQLWATFFAKEKSFGWVFNLFVFVTKRGKIANKKNLDKSEP